MTSYADLLGPRRGPVQTKHTGSTPAHVALTGRADMVKNAAGGYVFKADPWVTLRRFLVLGTTQGTYYASAEQLSNDALKLVDTLIEADPQRFVDTVVDVSVSGAPLKQSPVIFALARASSRVTGDPKRDTNNADPVTVGRVYALANAPKVLRTLQHVFEFLEYCRRQRGGGAALRRALSASLTGRDASQVEYQILKYRNREGWSPRDLLRYAHTKSAELDNLFAWTVDPTSEKGRLAVAQSSRLAAFEELQAGTSVERAAQLIADHRLSHEMVPNTMLSSREIWEALLAEMPLNAAVRNLRKMTQVGLLVDGSDAVTALERRLVNADALRRARVHPLRLLMALRQYRSGASRYGHGASFNPSREVLGILDQALELSYGTVTPLGKTVAVAIDVSGSMTQRVANSNDLSAWEAALILALFYNRTERRVLLSWFNRGAGRVTVSNRATMAELEGAFRMSGGTDISMSPRHYLDSGDTPDVLVTVTDNETWAGREHYVEALSKLRLRKGGPVAAVIAATSAVSSTVADPDDPHSLEVVGFDPTVPEAIAAHAQEVFR